MAVATGSLLDTYLLFFNDDDKAKLKEFGIRISSPVLDIMSRRFMDWPSNSLDLNPIENLRDLRAIVKRRA